MRKPSVFEYLDYRQFLRDTFAHRKEQSRVFSHRYLAGKARFSSPNFLQLVMTGKRNLTQKSAGQVAEAFEMGRTEREYFEALVFMNQAETHDQRNHYFLRLASVRGAGSARRLERAQYDYFSHWYYPVIREVATWKGGRLSAEEIAAVLDPVVKPKEVVKALSVLQELTLLERDEEGRWTRSDPALTTGPEVQSLIIANFHREMMRLAVEAIDRLAPDQRDVSAVTVGVNRNRMAELKEKIASFRKQILDLAVEDEDPAQVIQVNIQAFPLTKVLLDPAQSEPAKEDSR